MELDLRDRAYVVSGGSKGIGYAIARDLFNSGARVILGGRDQERCDAAAASLGPRDRALGIAGDMSEPGYETQLIGACTAAFSAFDGICISNGGPVAGSILDLDDAEWHRAFEQVFMGAVRMARASAKTFTTSGSILMVLSTSVIEPIPNLDLSNGLRPGLAMIAKSMSRTLAARGITVNALLPGRIETDRVKYLDDATGRPSSVRAEWEKKIPMGRYGTPQDAGALGAFLLSPSARYITGQAVAVDGGLTHSL